MVFPPTQDNIIIHEQCPAFEDSVGVSDSDLPWGNRPLVTGVFNQVCLSEWLTVFMAALSPWDLHDFSML